MASSDVRAAPSAATTAVTAVAFARASAAAWSCTFVAARRTEERHGIPL